MLVYVVVEIGISEYCKKVGVTPMGAIDTLLVEVVAQVVVQEVVGEVVGQKVKAVVGEVTDKDNELMV